MHTPQLRTYRHLLREINRQFTVVNGNRAWAAQLRQSWLAASQEPGAADRSTLEAQNALTYLANNRKYKELLAEFGSRMSEEDRIEKTARRVGLEAPKTYSETSPDAQR
ncbi:hypothetical protein GGF46_005062 [Coemansia sp. RSA 552]|nr:hypothetical protein GGF46_005062 [Coemansia sp. RSA 552]